MKKYLLILLIGFCFAISGPAFAGDVRDIDSEIWLEHVTQMRLLRQQILRIVTKPNQTVKDRDMLDALNRAFDEEKSTWDNYLARVAQGEETATKSAKYDKDCGHRDMVRARKCRSRGKGCGSKVKAGHECPKGDDCCKKTGISKCSDGTDCCDKTKVKARKRGKGCGEGRGKGRGEGCGESHSGGCGGDCCK